MKHTVELPPPVIEALAGACAHDNAARCVELCEQIVAVYENGDPDPANHDDYKLWTLGAGAAGLDVG